MKLVRSLLFGSILLLGVPAVTFAQVPENSGQATESTEPADEDRPVDDIVEKRMVNERKVMAYQPIRESDIFFEKRVWRIIDVREKMNLPFSYPEMPFFKILIDAATNGDITVYSTEDDKFSHRVEPNEVATMLSSVDSIVTINPETYQEEVKVVRNDINPEDIKRFRIKEVWFFDKETSTLNVRILGIAPLKEEFDDQGNLKFEKPLFWVYYPDCRELLARHKVFNPNNDGAQMSWEDLMEMRYFSSYIYKMSNVYDYRLQDFQGLSGVDLLLESDKLKMEIFNFENNLWAY